MGLGYGLWALGYGVGLWGWVIGLGLVGLGQRRRPYTRSCFIEEIAEKQLPR